MPEDGVRRRHVLFGCALLVLLVAFTYRDAPKNVFHFDDERNITRHPPVMIDTLTIENVVNAGRDALLPARPLPSMTFAIDWWRGGGDPRPFQQTNVAIHGATAIAVFALLFVVLGHRGHSPPVAGWAALAAAALWACHPIQVQAVTYVVQRMTSLAALFTVLTVLLYLLGRASAARWRRTVLLALAAACWLLGMASKENAAIAPFLVLLAEFGVLRQGKALIRRRYDSLLLAVPAIVAGLIAVDIVSGTGPLSAVFLPGYENRDFTLAERLMTQPRVIALHISQILWPVPGRFSLEHDIAVSTGLLSPPSTILALVAAAAWCGVGIRNLLCRGWRAVGFFMLWLPATLVIESSFIALEMVFEHRMYLPSIGLAGLVSLAVATMIRKAPRQLPATLAACCVVVALLAMSSSQEIRHWQSTLRLAQRSVAVAPGNARAWATLASVLHSEGREWNEVLPAVMRALEQNPGEFLALHLQAMYLVGVRRFEPAEEILGALEPRAERDHSLLNTIGMLRLGQGDYAAAIAAFGRASRLDPFRPEFQYNLALSYELAGRCAEAMAAWQAYLQQGTHQQRLASVRARLQNNFATAGGRCFGRY